MKLLFVDNSADLQQNWIEPLRAEGWGALRARSAEDADRMLLLHGDSIEIVVVSEKLVKWAETHEFPFVVLTSSWSEKEILAHQNSQRSAFFYQPIQGRVQDLKTAIQSFRSGSLGKPEKTKWAATRTIALEDFSGVLTKPEVTKTGTEGSIKLEAPSVFFGGEANPVAQTPKAPVSTADLTSVKIQPEKTQAKLELSPSNDSAQDKTTIRPLEVMEVKLEPVLQPDPAVTPAAPPAPDLGTAAPLGLAIPGLSVQDDAATRVAILPKQEAPPAPLASDPTMVLESTQVGAHDEEISEANLDSSEAIEEEQELVGDLSINEHVAYPELQASLKEAVGAPTSMIPPPAQVQSATSGLGSSGFGSPVMPPPVVRVIEGDEALKNYLALREQDVAVLTGQVRSAQERVHQLEMQLKVEKARSMELQHVVHKQEQTIQNFENEKQVELEVLYRQIEDLNVQLQERTQKAHQIEGKLKLAHQEVSKVKERVRVDIRRIRVREKELESQLEVLKKDSAALLQARDEKIVDLKRRLDLLEFNMELVQEQYSKERQSAEELRNRLKDAAKAMRQAGGLLEQ